VDRARQRKAELADRIDLIERLRSTMRAPVTLLETVSESAPHGLWLLEIKQAGTTVQLDGRAMSLTPVTDFAKQLQDSGFFQMPVEIVSTTSETVDETPVIHFVMKADVAPTGPAAASRAVTANTPPVPGAPAVAAPGTPPAPGAASPAIAISKSGGR